LEAPEKGSGTPITLAQIDTFWSGEVEKHNMGRSSKIMRDGKLVAQTYSKVYLDDVRRTFRQIRTEFVKADPGDNAVPVLRDTEGVMAWLRAKNTKNYHPSGGRRHRHRQRRRRGGRPGR
jgi:hypothetical protein